MTKATYLNCCVSWPRRDVYAPGGLCDMIDSGREITRRSFCRRVDPESRREVEQQLGYDHDFPITRDCAVEYRTGRLHGRRVWFIRHSSIEYVFATHHNHSTHED